MVQIISIADLDRIDLKILDALSEDGRVSWRDLADQVGLSLTPVLRRVKRLEDAGVIKGYGARLDETRLHGSMNAFVSVTLAGHTTENIVHFETEVLKLPQVMGCYLMTGDFDFLLRVVARDMNEYEQIIVKGVSKIKGVAKISSNFAFRTVIERRGASAGRKS